jgi:hypothetical protein
VSEKFCENGRNGFALAAIYLFGVYSLPCLPNSRADYCTINAQDSQYGPRPAQPILAKADKSNPNRYNATAVKQNCGGGILCSVVWPRIQKISDRSTDDPIALFTIVLAISTIGLWQQTGRLARQADDQSAKMADSIEAAKKSAEAADLQAKAMVAQLRPIIALTGKQIELIGGIDPAGRRIVANTSNLAPGFHPIVTVHNAGPGNAFIESVSCDWFMGRDPPVIPIRGHYSPTFRILKPDQTYVLDLAQHALAFLPTWRARIDLGEEWLWLYGSVRFKDILGSVFEQGFIAHWDQVSTAPNQAARGLVVEGPAAYNSLVQIQV